jgi:hypothetical protein
MRDSSIDLGLDSSFHEFQNFAWKSVAYLLK